MRGELVGINGRFELVASGRPVATGRDQAGLEGVRKADVGAVGVWTIHLATEGVAFPLASEFISQISRTRRYETNGIAIEIAFECVPVDLPCYPIPVSAKREGLVERITPEVGRHHPALLGLVLGKERGRKAEKQQGVTIEHDNSSHCNSAQASR